VQRLPAWKKELVLSPGYRCSGSKDLIKDLLKIQVLSLSGKLAFKPKGKRLNHTEE
jgi:hypothetical protein